MKKTLLGITIMLAACVALNAQVVSRIISHAEYYNAGGNAPGALNDSITYHYDNPGYGGDATHAIRFSVHTVYQAFVNDTPTYLTINKQTYDVDTNVSGIQQVTLGAGNAYAGGTKLIYIHDGAGNLLSDTSYTSTDSTGLHYIYSALNSFTYNTQNQVLSSIYAVWNPGTSAWGNPSKTAYAYDAHGNHVSTGNYGWNSGTSSYSLTILDSMVYNASNLLISDTRYSFSSGTLHPQNLTVYTYNVQNDMETDTLFGYNAGWQYSSFDHFVFDNNHRQIADTTINYTYYNQSTQQTLHGYFPFEISKNTYNADGLLIFNEEDFSQSLIWVPTNANKITYNNYNQETSNVQQVWSNSSSNWIDLGNAYYYNYGAPVAAGVEAVGSDIITLNIFPNPSTQQFNLYLRSAEKTSFKVTITDMAGRLIKYWNERDMSQYQRTISTTDWASGNYMVTVTTPGGTISKPVVVKR